MWGIIILMIMIGYLKVKKRLIEEGYIKNRKKIKNEIR